MQLKPRVVTVADDPELSRIRGWMERSAIVLSASTVRAGLLLIDGTEAAVIVEDAAAVGDVAALLTHARALGPDTELVVAASAAAASARVFEGVAAWPAPVERSRVEDLLERAVERESARANRLERVIERWSDHHSLTRAERRIIELLAQGVPRRDLPEITRTADATIKTHIRQILRKCHRAAMADLMVAMLRAAAHEPVVASVEE